MASKTHFGEGNTTIEPNNIENPWSQKSVLTLDGSGVRGYYSLLILTELMKTIRERENDIIDNERRWYKRHCMAGTSTGGLIALMLCRFRTDVQSCLSVYQTNLPNILGSSWKAKLGSNYSSIGKDKGHLPRSNRWFDEYLNSTVWRDKHLPTLKFAYWGPSHGYDASREQYMDKKRGGLYQSPTYYFFDRDKDVAAQQMTTAMHAVVENFYSQRNALLKQLNVDPKAREDPVNETIKPDEERLVDSNSYFLELLYTYRILLADNKRSKLSGSMLNSNGALCAIADLTSETPCPLASPPPLSCWEAALSKGHIKDIVAVLPDDQLDEVRKAEGKVEAGLDSLIASLQRRLIRKRRRRLVSRGALHATCMLMQIFGIAVIASYNNPQAACCVSNAVHQIVPWLEASHLRGILQQPSLAAMAFLIYNLAATMYYHLRSDDYYQQHFLAVGVVLGLMCSSGIIDFQHNIAARAMVFLPASVTMALLLSTFFNRPRGWWRDLGYSSGGFPNTRQLSWGKE